MFVSSRKRLSAQDWVDAALLALAEGGLPALAVEPLAVRLGTTKGSFYWHFANRDALLDAALAHWERAGTEQVIADLDRDPDPRARLRTLLVTALTPAIGRTAASIELALQPAAAHPPVAAVLDRVTRRRLEYLAALFGELGFATDEARHRGTLAYTAYLGHAQLAHATPGVVPAGPPSADYVTAVLSALVGS